MNYIDSSWLPESVLTVHPYRAPCGYYRTRPMHMCRYSPSVMRVRVSRSRHPLARTHTLSMLINVCITRRLQVINYSAFVVRFSVLLARYRTAPARLCHRPVSHLSRLARECPLMTACLFYDVVKLALLKLSLRDVAEQPPNSRRALMVIEPFSRRDTRDKIGPSEIVA